MKKLIFIFSVATIATISFVSCEKDNDKDSAAGYDLSAYKALSEFERANCYELGLSVFWGRCNLGTSDATEYGDYFTWGDNSASEGNLYRLNYYRWYDGEKIFKYNDDDKKTTLESDDDAAYAEYHIWGRKWRMPTAAEFEELIATKDNPDYKWEWNSQEGQTGYRITFLKTNHSIFLPTGGRVFAGRHGLYWSSSVKTDNINLSYALYFDDAHVILYPIDRYVGLSIRPVREK